MRINRRRVLPRRLPGVVNQIALSVAASLIATALWSGLRPDRPAATAQPDMPGGAFEAQSPAGGDINTPARQTASVRAFALHYPAALVDDQGWGALQAQATPTVSAVLARPVRVVRNVKRIVTAVGGGPSPVRPAPIPPAEPQALPAPELSDRPDDVWSTAASAARTLVAVGGALVGHLLP